MSEPQPARVAPAFDGAVARVARRRVGSADVVALRGFTRDLRALDYRYGGGRCVEAAVARLPAALALLGLPTADRVVAPLRTEVADLHNLAAWACFDMGRAGDALRHFRVALTLAESSGDEALVSNIHYRLGRVHLHHNAPGSALAEFGLGERAARASGSPRAEAVVAANQAWAHARTGSAGEAVARLHVARDCFARVARGEVVPGWAAFFTAAELSAITGMVHTELARTADPRQVDAAVPALVEAVEGYGAPMARSRTFSLIPLAVCHLLDGQVDRGVALGGEAVDQCEVLASARTSARLRPLHDVAARLSAHAGARALAVRIREFRPAGAVAAWPNASHSGYLL
ncbi:hypothetical protein FHS29_007301 [Saccharothrix tamanrassetensis]|uniref:Tetratricopeptide repeat protein n=1 Tax=Saccharothrix tamanrassetensis TaxID=1051531 RepID=A0A841CV21_9PSEU|nr:tetratricopeptide repeat protein [Saccharothrix tamanrassetensis]MBB5960673.1 hypothetical protein [Saccharothrix tamanrassetensis]